MHYEHGGNVHRFLRENPTLREAVLDFSANINPLGISEKGKVSMLQSLEWLSHYPDPEYIELKDKLSAYYQVDAQNISLFNGGAEGLHELFRYLRPKKVLIPVPTFVEYEKALAMHQVQMDYFYLKEEEQFKLNEDRFLMTVEIERPDLVVICTPNNPTGQQLDVHFLEKISENMKRWNGKLVIDEAFIDFLPNKENSAAKWLCFQSNLYILKSFTKFFGVPGLRLGAVLTSDQSFHRAIDDYGVPWRINSMAEHYALGALEDFVYIEQTRSFIQTERLFLSEALSAISGVKVFDSCADYLLMKIESSLLAEFESSLKNEGILVRNCQNYKGLSEGYFRVAVKNRVSNERLIKAMTEVSK
jgi:threonine-phosphate decarboxylase